jgi:polysaccharide export outer membrane protein
MKNDWMFSVCLAFVLVAGQAICVAQAESSGSSKVAVPGSSPNTLAGRGAARASVSATSSAEPAPSTPTLGAAPQFQQRDSRYKIQPGDSFDVTFELSPEFNQTGVAVQPDGFVTLHGVGDIKLQGQTVPQFTETLRKVYGKILKDPAISVVLKDFQRPYFIADGQVGHPGKYELRGDTTLTEAIAMAGGFLDAAKHSQVVLYRRVDDNWTSAQLINVKKMEADRNLREDPFLHPGDMLFVPKNTLSKIKPFIPSTGVGAYIPIM